MTDHPAAIAERERIVALVRQWMVHERECMNIKGTMLLINLRCAIERGDHITQSGGRGEAD